MLINEIQDQIIDEFAPLSDSIDKYKKLIQLAKNLDPLDQKSKTTENSIKGCQSNVWLITEIEDNKMKLKGDTEVIITKGILSLLLRVYNDQKLSDISSSELYFLERIGLKQSLSPQRANGVKAIVEHIQNVAKKNIL